MDSAGRLLPGEPSAAVQAAQALLWQLREKHGVRAGARYDVSPRAGEAAGPPETNWLLINAQVDLQRRRQDTATSNSASHSVATLCTPTIPPNALAPSDDSSARSDRTIVAHPSILLAVLKQHMEAPGRVWLLLRAIDRDGRGWLSVEDARHHLTDGDSPLRVCGWRRLRQILKQGEGVFWQRDGQDRLWLRGAHRVACNLDCGRLQGFPVELPVESLLRGIQSVRAAFYASFHGGRDSRPISRDTLAALSGVPGRTQLEYDRVARVERTRNIAIGERHTAENAQERAWKHGRAVFRFIDAEGRQGRAGREYVAWHLPNSYRADYHRRSRGSRKRLNRKLAGLVNKGIPGNDDHAIEKLFFANGALAAKRYNRSPERDAYWRQERPTRVDGGLWWLMAGMGR